MDKLLAQRNKGEKTKQLTHTAATDVRDARFRDNNDDISVVAKLHKRLDNAGKLERRLTRSQLVNVMRANRTSLRT